MRLLSATEQPWIQACLRYIAYKCAYLHDEHLVCGRNAVIKCNLDVCVRLLKFKICLGVFCFVDIKSCGFNENQFFTFSKAIPETIKHRHRKQLSPQSLFTQQQYEEKWIHEGAHWMNAVYSSISHSGLFPLVNISKAIIDARRKSATMRSLFVWHFSEQFFGSTRQYSFDWKFNASLACHD